MRFSIIYWGDFLGGGGRKFIFQIQKYKGFADT